MLNLDGLRTAKDRAHWEERIKKASHGHDFLVKSNSPGAAIVQADRTIEVILAALEREHEMNLNTPDAYSQHNCGPHCETRAIIEKLK